jgi:hypothetical protein
MYGSNCYCLLAFTLLLFQPMAVRAQSDSSGPTRDFTFPISPPRIPLPPTAGPPIRPPFNPTGIFGLTQLTQAAGTIFAGTVTAVAHQPATGSQAIETVAITFHVEQAIRGATPGQNLTITQWMGLWSSGQRYRVGERLLLFLYPQSKLGLTSCVGAGMGRFSFDAWGRVLFSAQHLAAFQMDPILGGKSAVTFNDFAQALRQAEGSMPHSAVGTQPDPKIFVR